MIVAVDGPSAAGKSTVARAVADALGMPYLDTGSMYRAVTWAVLRKGVDVDYEEACSAVARSVDLTVLGPGRIAVDGLDVSEDIRGPEVTAAVSAVSRHPGVRAHLVTLQRAIPDERGAVVEGRDIGTVVFPEAPVKLFLTAHSDERARRRAAESGGPAGGDLARRDLADSTRAVAPLVPAADAVRIDTTGRAAEDVAAEIVEMVRAVCGPEAGATPR